MTTDRQQRISQTRKLYDSYTSMGYAELQDPRPDAVFAAFDLNYAPFLPSNRDAAILDIGCGMGHFLMYCQQRGYRNVQGVEVSREQVEYCREQGLDTVSLIDDLVEHLLALPSTFDFIMMSDVLEHIPKDRIIETLEAVRQALQPDGLVVLRIPNVANLTGVALRYKNFTHEVTFDERSAVQVCRLAGFKEVTVLPNRTYYRAKWKGVPFELLRACYYLLLRAIFFIENPGDQNPRIFTKVIVVVARPTPS